MFSLAISSNFHTFNPPQPQWSTDLWNTRPYNVSVFRTSIPITMSYSWNFPHPYRHSPFLFQDYHNLSTQPSWRQRCKKYCPSMNMKPQTEFLDGLATRESMIPRIQNWGHQYLQIHPLCICKQHVPHFLLSLLFIKYWKNPGKIPKRILQIKWIIHSIPEKKHLRYYFDITQSKYLHLDGSPIHSNPWNTSTYQNSFSCFHLFRSLPQTRKLMWRSSKSMPTRI